jgi:hypothetical protein
VSAEQQETLDAIPHLFQACHPILDEAPAALYRAGEFLSVHLAGAERVTGERKAEPNLSP